MADTKNQKSIDESIDQILNDKPAQTEAVQSLIRVSDKVSGTLGSDIELKTDLSPTEICLHTAVDMLAHFLAMSPDQFQKAPILEKLTTLKERKNLSKNRLSRREIVEVAKTPEMNFGGMGEMGGGMVNNWFKSKKNRQ